MRISRRKAAVLLLIIMLVAGGEWFSWPRHADLRAFDVDRMAVSETAMWRDYYNRNFVALFYRLYAANRNEFNFSPLDSVQIAFNAADAARRFQPTTSRAAAEAARQPLIHYYDLLAQGAPVRFDPAKVADLELDWWQARREHIAPEVYGLTIARVSGLLYGIDPRRLQEAGIVRARAMAFRDSRGDRMADADWQTIALSLRVAYAELRAAIHDPGAQAHRISGR